MHDPKPPSSHIATMFKEKVPSCGMRPPCVAILTWLLQQHVVLNAACWGEGWGGQSICVSDRAFSCQPIPCDYTSRLLTTHLDCPNYTFSLFHEHGIGFLVGKDTVNTVMGFRPVSRRLIAVHLRTVPSQHHSSTSRSDYDYNEIE